MGRLQPRGSAPLVEMVWEGGGFLMRGKLALNSRLTLPPTL